MPLTDWERALCDGVDAGRLMALTERLAVWVRLSGSSEELAAAHHLRDVLDGCGLRTELLSHDAYVSLPGPAHLEIGGERLPCITHSFAASTGADGFEGEVADAAGPTPEVAGRIALLPGLAGPGPVAAGEAAGALAQVYVNGPLTHEMIVSGVWGSPAPEDLALLPRTPVVSITDATAATLRARLKGGDRRLRIVASVDTGWRPTPLLLAWLDGPGDEFVLFSGHLDSWHRGAMDNGSANATMVEVARLLAGRQDGLRRSLLVAFWSGHSHGRYSGSAWFADDRWLDLATRCVAHVNIDSVGGRDATLLSQGVVAPSLRILGADVLEALTGAAFEGTHVGRAGDQSFLGHGIPSLWMSLSEQPDGGLGWWWHTTEDTPDKLDPDLLARDARVYVAAVGRLVAEAALPLVAAGRFDLEPATSRAARLEALAAELDALRPAAAAPPGTIAAFNRALLATLRPLVAVGHTAGGPWRPDPALPQGAVPLLDPVARLAGLAPRSDEERFLLVALTRARNRVVAALEASLAAAAAGVAALRA